MMYIPATHCSVCLKPLNHKEDNTFFGLCRQHDTHYKLPITRPMNGSKLLWLGLTLIVTAPVISFVPVAPIVGAVIMIIGCVLYLLDR